MASLLTDFEVQESSSVNGGIVGGNGVVAPLDVLQENDGADQGSNLLCGHRRTPDGKEQPRDSPEQSTFTLAKGFQPNHTTKHRRQAAPHLLMRENKERRALRKIKNKVGKDRQSFE